MIHQLFEEISETCKKYRKNILNNIIQNVVYGFIFTVGYQKLKK